jgi:hypothetical protein
MAVVHWMVHAPIGFFLFVFAGSVSALRRAKQST